MKLRCDLQTLIFYKFYPLYVRLENLKTCYDLITKHGVALQRALTELESSGDDQSLASKTKIVNERATLFRISSNAMINSCSDYLQTAQTQGTKWSRMLQHEREQKQHLEEMVEQLARQHSHLEQAAVNQRQKQQNKESATTHSQQSDDEDNEFYDAQEEENLTISSNEDSFILKIQPSKSKNYRNCSVDDDDHSSSENEDKKCQQKFMVVADQKNSADEIDRRSNSSVNLTPVADQVQSYHSGSSGLVKKRRTTVPEKPNYPLNLWSIIKNCIGKDLSKIPMPVNFNEPLSMLQRLTEDFEYAELLDSAAKCKSPSEQLAWIAAFTISSYSTTANRTGKPFNPLLGETYELDRTEDLGWRCINEQVSHHPPIAAQFCEGKGWRCYQEFTMVS